MGIGKEALTANELRLNPKLNDAIKVDLVAGASNVRKTGTEARQRLSFDEILPPLSIAEPSALRRQHAYSSR